MTHCLKTWPEYFDLVECGLKTFEIRENDRNFQVGDTLILMKYDPSTCMDLNLWITVIVTYMTTWAQQNNTVVMGIRFNRAFTPEKSDRSGEPES